MGLIRLAGIVKESFTDGEGIRYVIFTQGCLHNCAGCHNPETHCMSGGFEKNIDEIVDEIGKNPLLDGVTLSGGDPMFQVDECYELVSKIRERYRDLNIWLYTGFKYEYIMNEDKLNISGESNRSRKELLMMVDVVVDGRFEESLRDLSLNFRGSSNQRLIDVKKSIKDNKIIRYIE